MQVKAPTKQLKSNSSFSRRWASENPGNGTAVSRLSEPRATKKPWWLWPHLWSLDAPLVAVAWQGWWAHFAGVKLGWAPTWTLALAVWWIYLADRWLDARRDLPFEHGTARHAFYGGRQRAVGLLVLGLGLFLTATTPWWLTRREFSAGLGLLALAALYFGTIHHATHGSWTARWPKEAAVGGLFALGSFLFVGCQVVGAHWLALAVLGFACLCFLNCALITGWENSARDRRDPASLLNAFPELSNRLRAGCWSLALVSFGLVWMSGSLLFLPLALGAALLGVLDDCRKALSADSLRVWADVVLLVPWCLLPFMQ